jgi:hypothetical protein
MKILIFTDIHGDWRAVERLVAQPADVYVAAGDLSTFGRGTERCLELLKPLGERVWLLPGNHETHDETRAMCARFGFTDFHRRTRTLPGAGGATFWAGLGYSNPTPFNTPGEYTEEEIATALAEIEAAAARAGGGKLPMHFVVHFPPHGTRLDQVSFGRHAGSRVLRAWVERVQPAALYCGHIHECAGKDDTLGATRCFNVGKSGHVVEI